MGSVQYYCAASLDGFVAESDDTLEWLTSYEGSYEGDDAVTMEGSYDAFYESVGALVMGSATYEFVLEEASSWPYAGRPTWILSSRELPLPKGAEHEPIEIVDAPVAELHPRMLEAAGGRNLWVVGGGNVASQYADQGLLDEVLVTVVPVVLGEGKPLFDRRLPGAPMTLTGVTPRDNAMVELRYAIGR